MFINIQLFATPKDQKVLRSFNCKNGKYAIKGQNGTWGTPVDMAFLDSIALESNVGVTPIYGDGEIQKESVSDTSKTGSLVTTGPDTDLELATGMKIQGTNGLYDVAMRSKTPLAIYVEVVNESIEKAVIGKKWILNATISPASQVYDQNTDTPNANNWSYPLTVLGTEAETADGEIYTDANGFRQRVYVITSRPNDEGYATFGESVPTPVITTEPLSIMPDILGVY